MSFTLFYKGHTIHVGPERASRGIQSSELEAKYFNKRTLDISLQEIIQNKLEEPVSSSRVNTSNSKVHNIPLYKLIKYMGCNWGKN